MQIFSESFKTMEIENKTIKKLFQKPRTIFLIDGIGALISALSLLGVVIFFKEYFRMHQSVLIVLSGIAFLLAAFSLTCYCVLKSNWSIFLQIIITANLLYCGLTSFMLFYHFENLTILGVTYFIVEIMAILTLVVLEFSLIKYFNSNRF